MYIYMYISHVSLPCPDDRNLSTNSWIRMHRTPKGAQWRATPPDPARASAAGPGDCHRGLQFPHPLPKQGPPWVTLAVGPAGVVPEASTKPGGLNPGGRV